MTLWDCGHEIQVLDSLNSNRDLAETIRDYSQLDSGKWHGQTEQTHTEPLMSVRQHVMEDLCEWCLIKVHNLWSNMSALHWGGYYSRAIYCSCLSECLCMMPWFLVLMSPVIYSCSGLLPYINPYVRYNG